MKKIIFLGGSIIFIIGVLFAFHFNNQKENVDSTDNLEGEREKMDETLAVNMEINGVLYSATLIDNETTRELLNRLPLTITMNELNGNEKYYYFDEIFPSHSSQVGHINNGDIMLYHDDCLVLFYDDLETSYRYTKIGSIDNPENLKNVVGKESIIVHISR